MVSPAAAAADSGGRDGEKKQPLALRDNTADLIFRSAAAVKQASPLPASEGE